MSRKAHNIHYIYKTTCNVTGRWYVGMHSTSNENDGYMGSGTVLRRSIRKYGEENHTKQILEYCDSREELVLREIEIVTKELIQDENCINLKEGGTGGFSSEEHMMKFVKAGGNGLVDKMNFDEEFKLKILTNLNYARKKAHKDGKKKYDNFRDKLHSEETKQLMSENSKGQGVGEENSQYGTCWVMKDGLNKKIKKEEITQWTNEGWEKGRKYDNKRDNIN